MPLSATLLYPYILISPQQSVTGAIAVDTELSGFGVVLQVYAGGSGRVSVGQSVFFSIVKPLLIQSTGLVDVVNETGVGILVDEFDIKLIELSAL